MHTDSGWNGLYVAIAAQWRRERVLDTQLMCKSWKITDIVDVKISISMLPGHIGWCLVFPHRTGTTSSTNRYLPRRHKKWQPCNALLIEMAPAYVQHNTVSKNNARHSFTGWKHNNKNLDCDYWKWENWSTFCSRHRYGHQPRFNGSRTSWPSTDGMRGMPTAAASLSTLTTCSPCLGASKNTAKIYESQSKTRWNLTEK